MGNLTVMGKLEKVKIFGKVNSKRDYNGTPNIILKGN